MRVPRILVERPLECGSEIALDDKAARHVTRVLRLKAGAAVTLFDGRGGEYRAELTRSDKSETRVRVETLIEASRESPLSVTLLQGISRGERMDYTLQKAVELGVRRIIPVSTARTVVRLEGNRAEKRLRHWMEVIRSASEQSGRTRVPELGAVQSLREGLASARGASGLLLEPRAGASLNALARPDSAPCLLVGPEGGLNDEEIAMARGAGFQPIRLGPRVLRTETAGVAALAIMQALWGDMG